MKHKKLLSLLLAICLMLSLLPAVAAADTTNVTDTLTNSLTSGGYTTWTVTETASGAAYSIFSYGNNKGYIQLKSKDNVSGIVTTASAGKATKILVEWNTATTNGRTLNIYGKNSAYSSASELYSTSTQGTLLGTIVKGTSTELTISGDYEYIGMRSNSGAMYLDSIQISWSKDSDAPQPETYTVSFDAGEGTGTMADQTTTGSFTLPACAFTAPEGKEFDCWKISGDDTEYAVGDTVTISANTTFVAQWKDLPVVTYTDMMLKRVPANGDVVVIYYPTAGKVMTGTDYLYNNKKHELVAADATLTDDVLAVPSEAVRLTVSIDADGKYTFATADGKYLMADGTNVQLVDEQGANTLFQLETAAAGTDNYYIKCDSAVYNGNAQYIEYYGGYFTVYGMGSNTAIYTFQFFSEDGEGPTPAVTYTVSFDAGEGSGTMEDVTDATSPYTLPECTFTAPEGCVFDGWQAADGTVYAAGAEVTLEGNTTFTATWKVLEAKIYTLVTSADDLVDGGTYLIASELFADELYIMSKQTNNNRAQYKVTGVEGTTLTMDKSWIAANASDDLAFEFTLTDAEDGWAFYDAVTGGYLYAASSSSNWLRTETELDDNGKFTLDLGEGGAIVPIALGENTRNYMHYNGKSNIFSCYAETSSIEAAVYLYKLVEEEPVELNDGFYLIGPDWTVNAINPANVFGQNMEAGGELVLATTLAEGDQIKVVKVENGAITAWYPDGLDTQYTVDAAHAGNVNIYFRETYSNDWSAFGGYFYIEAGYNITCVSGEHGLVSTAMSRAAAGTTVTVYLEAEEDYEVDTLTVMCGETEVETTKVNDWQYTFVMPEGNVTVTATFTIPATEPFFKSQTLLLDGMIGVNFNMELPEISGVDYTTSYMTFAVSHGTCTERVDYNAARIRNSVTKGFVCYVPAVHMTEPITATFHYTQNGTEKTIEKVYSINDYFTAFDQAVEAGEITDAEMITLVHALADYGYYAQLFLADRKNWTAGTDYTAMTTVYATNYDIGAVQTAVADDAIIRTTGGNVEKITYSLALDSATKIRVYFSVTTGYTGTFTLNDDSYESTMDGARHLVIISNIAAHELSKKYTITATTDDGEAQVVVSALSYVQSLLAAYTDAAAQNAAAAIYAYSQAADAYKAAH